MSARFLNMTVLVSLITLNSVLGISAHAPDVKTVTKKLTVRIDIGKILPTKTSTAKMLSKWGIGAWWSRGGPAPGTSGFDSVYIGNGMEIALMSPEYIAAITNEKAKSKLMTADEAQMLFAENLGLYWGTKVCFDGYIQIDQYRYNSGLSAINSEWTFYLITNEGKRIKPSKVTLSNLYYYYYQGATSSLRRNVRLIFENLNSDIGKPLLGSDTLSLSLAIAGEPGSVIARFEFDPKKK